MFARVLGYLNALAILSVMTLGIKYIEPKNDTYTFLKYVSLLNNNLEWGEPNLSSLGEIRSNIDKIDKEIVVLLCKRGELVKQAARFKPNPANVKDLKRLEQIIEKVTAYAKEMNFDSFTIENIYRNMVEQFIQLEMKTYSELRSNSNK